MDESNRSETIRLRLMTREDIPCGMRLKDLAGWNQTPADWEAFLSLRPEGCFVAEVEGRPAGTVTTIDHGGSFGWVGMVLVDPALRRRGIGTRLLEAGMESLTGAGCETIKLDATPAGREVYLRLGFSDEYRLSRLVRAGGSKLSLPEAPREILPLAKAGLPAVAAYDAPIFGKPRAEVLEIWRRRAPHRAHLLLGPGGLRGYSLGREGSRHEHIGPLVADSMEAAKALLQASLRAAGDRPLVLDAFLHDRRWLDLLAALGFREERGFTRMFRGPNRFPGQPQRQWAASGPELG